MTPEQEEIIAEWLKRLRSGLYQQGKNTLRSDQSFCCLGVLAEIVYERGLITRICTPRSGVDVYSYDGISNALSPFIVDLVGLSSPTAGFADPICIDAKSGKGRYHSLAQLNDAGVPFERIADLIEQYSDSLFPPKEVPDATTK